MPELDDWTKKELSLRPGIVQLACAVIEQWKLDGSPKCDEPAIKYWTKIINDYKKDNPRTVQVSLSNESVGGSDDC